MTVADRLAADHADRLRSYGLRAPHRSVDVVAGVSVVSFGIPEPWGTQVVALPERPDPAAVDAAVVWARDRGRDPWVVVRSRDRSALPSYDVVEELVAFAAAAAGPGQSLLTVERSHDVELIRSLYGDAFGMRPGLADALVVPADLDALAHLVGSVAGRPVAYAQLRMSNGLGYLSGVGVLPTDRRRGYGGAILAAARSVAAKAGCELVWLTAERATAPFYESVGFEPVDTHVALSAPA